MAILNNNPLVGASGNQGGYNINNSLRFRSSASAYLSRTPASTSGNQIFTTSFWIKRGTLGVSQNVFYSFNNTNNADTLYFPSSDAFGIAFYTSGAYSIELVTTQVFRDPSAWYHIVVAIDTTQATASNRAKLYVNGNQVTAFSTATYPTQNATFTFNTNVAHVIGASNYVSLSGYIDGYLAEVNWITGQALTPSSFGETDTTTGVWKPKKYTGTYGTNGYYLPFSDIATTSGSNAGLGKDFSGNSNYWTTNNISVTSDSTYDAMTDSPTLTSATVANYCVLNSAAPSYRASGTSTISNGNLTSTDNASSYGLASVGTISISSGKWYWEVNATSIGGSYGYIGIAKTDTLSLGSSNIEGYIYSSLGYKASGAAAFAGIPSATYGASWTTGDVIGIALDMDAGTLVFYKNGASQGTAYTGITGEYVAGLGDGQNSTAYTFNINFGQRPFAYTPPTGYVALNTYNLPTPTILQGNKYMDATLYTGTGSALTITNAGAFKPDLVWVKSRSNAYNNVLNDSVRGSTILLISNSTDAEQTETQSITSFNSNGFSLGTAGTWNQNASTFVGWQWQAGQGSTSSNTSGSITSTVSVNTTAGFSIATFTSTGAAATVGHGLGVAPRMIIVKARNNVSGWAVYHASVGNTGALRLDTTAATSTTIDWWRDTSPTSSVFSIGANFPNAYTSVAYCFAEIAGFSKFGSYTGNGSTDGPFVYLGFRPKFLLVKEVTTGGTNWIISDSSRDTYNLVNDILIPNLANAEDTAGAWVDFVSNGFKIRYGSVLAYNQSGQNYIYMAFAENPFKNSLAR